MTRFEIEELQPTGHADLWKAIVSVRTPETIDGIDVGQNATLTVRFSYPVGHPVSGLLEAATRKAEDCLASAASFLSGRSAIELQDFVRAEREAEEAELSKPFVFPLAAPEA